MGISTAFANRFTNARAASSDRGATPASVYLILEGVVDASVWKNSALPEAEAGAGE